MPNRILVSIALTVAAALPVWAQVRSEHHIIPIEAAPAFRDFILKYSAPATDATGVKGLRVSTAPDELTSLGFRDGDLIRRVNTDYVTTGPELKNAFSKAMATPRIDVILLREGRSHQIGIGLQGATAVAGEPVVVETKPTPKRRKDKPMPVEEPAVEMQTLPADAPAAGAPTLAPAPPPGPKEFLVDEAEFEAEWERIDYLVLLTEVQPVMYTSPDGSVTGITSGNLAHIRLAQKLGLQNNDVLFEINGHKLDSPDKIFTLAEQLEGLETYNVRILRGGTPIEHIYKVKKN